MRWIKSEVMSDVKDIVKFLNNLNSESAFQAKIITNGSGGGLCETHWYIIYPKEMR